jgi:L,D-transpeptidase YcbB
MGSGDRLVMGLAIGAALAVSAIAATAAPASLLAPDKPSGFGAIEPSPLLATFDSPPATAEPSDLGPFARLAQTDARSVAAPVPADAPAVADAPPLDRRKRSASPAPDPAQTAVFEALVRLIRDEGKVNPLGEGDWRAARAAIGAFYAGRDFRPLFVDEGGFTAAGRSVLKRLTRAGEDGLNLAPFALPRDDRAVLTPAERADAETTIAAAIVVYAAQATGSRIEPSRISRLVTAGAGAVDFAAALADTAAAPDAGEKLLGFNPPQAGYRALRDELQRLAGSAPVRPRHAKAAGSVTAIAAIDEAAAFGPTARRRARILANMEMWRWQPRDMGERRIEVNVPDYSVAVVDGEAVIHRARVIVGKPDTPTPIFSDVMRYVLINPAWQVPDSIVKKEILPRLNHFTRLGYEVKTIGGRVTVRQPPGESNALGRLAFMFPNEHSVYLHDTPARQAFDEEMRALSHGCVRVEEPERLAELVLGWPESRIDAAIGGQERTVFLPTPWPIHIEYFTEFVDESGELQERADIYGLTQKVADILSDEGQD